MRAFKTVEELIDLEEGQELEIDNEYIMSPEDLCTIEFLDQLIDTGITLMKSEGRGRTPEYIKTVFVNWTKIHNLMIYTKSKWLTGFY